MSSEQTVVSLPCPFCGVDVEDILKEHSDECYFTLNEKLQNGPPSGWTRDSINRVNMAWNVREVVAQPQGEPVAYLDLEKIQPAGMAYATKKRVNHRQIPLYAEQPAPVAHQETKINQCDGCQAGIPLINGTHRMGEPDGYANKIKCTADLYK